MYSAQLAAATEFQLTGAVASPSSNVLCVNVGKSNIAPLIYAEWPNARFEIDNFTRTYVPWSGWEDDSFAGASSPWPNSTVVDALLEWGMNGTRTTPIFPIVSCAVSH